MIRRQTCRYCQETFPEEWCYKIVWRKGVVWWFCENHMAQMIDNIMHANGDIIKEWSLLTDATKKKLCDDILTEGKYENL